MHPSESTKKKPDFFIIGAPKCGTTAMADALKQHPDIFFTTPKEPHYFSRDIYPGSCKNLNQYLKYYRHASSHKKCGEGTVFTFYSEKGLNEIVSSIENPKFILMLRNPIEASISMHGELLKPFDDRIREVTDDFHTAWNLLPTREKGMGLPKDCIAPLIFQYDYLYQYYPHLKRLHQLISKDQLHIIIYDDFIKNPRREYQKICDFLDINGGFEPTFKWINERYQLKKGIAPKLLSLFLNSQLDLKKIIPLHLRNSAPVQFIRNLYNKPLPKPELDEKFLNEMKQFFSEDIKKTSLLLNRDLTHWLD